MATRRRSKRRIIQVDTTAAGHVAAVLDTRGFEPLSNYGSFGRGEFGKGMFGNARQGLYEDKRTGAQTQ